MCRLLCSVIRIRAATAQRSVEIFFPSVRQCEKQNLVEHEEFQLPQTIPKKDLTNQVKSETKTKCNTTQIYGPSSFCEGTRWFENILQRAYIESFNHKKHNDEIYTHTHLVNTTSFQITRLVLLSGHEHAANMTLSHS